MKIKQSCLSLFRSAAFVLMGLGILNQVGCSTTGQPNSGGWTDSRSEDLTKIFVYPLTASPNLQLPVTRANAPKILTTAIQQQLYEAQRLQTDERVHSLSLYGVVLSYQNGIIDVQGEIYDDDQFLVYSRVTRRLEAGEDWNQGLNLVAEQMLDELMLKLYPPTQTGGGPSEPCRFSGCRPTPWVPTTNIYLFDSYCWGCWRDDGYWHNPNPKPRPKPHWVPGAILESLPRIPHEHPIPPRGISESGTPGTGGFAGGRGHGSGSTTAPSSGSSLEPSSSSGSGSIYQAPRSPGKTRGDHLPLTREPASSPSSEASTPTSSRPVFQPPRSVEISPPQSAPVVRETPPEPRAVESTPTRSTPSYEPPRSSTVSEPSVAPVTHESPRSAPTISVPIETHHSEPTRSMPDYGGSSPRSHESSHSGGSSGDSSSSSTGGGGHGGGHGGGRHH